MDYPLIRSARKTLAICVGRDGSVVVRAPMRASGAEIERFVAARNAWITAAVARQKARAGCWSDLPAEEAVSLLQRARTLLPGKVSFFAEKMGVCPAGIRITSAKTRFGSCSSKGRLCFSLYLMRFPEEAVDYVVVHELAHLRCMNHSKQFYAVVASVMPDWKVRARMLKEPI